MTRSRWFLPLFAVALGLAILLAQALAGHTRSGLESLGIMTGFGAVLLLGPWRGDARDERARRTELHAVAFSGLAVVAAVVAACVVELARGHNASPYSWLAGVAGLAYLVAVVALRLRG